MANAKEVDTKTKKKTQTNKSFMKNAWVGPRQMRRTLMALQTAEVRERGSRKCERIRAEGREVQNQRKTLRVEKKAKSTELQEVKGG